MVKSIVGFNYRFLVIQFTTFRPFKNATAILLVLAVLVTSGCWNGKILLADADFTDLKLPSTGQSIGVKGVPRAEMNKYQGAFEKQIVAELRYSGMFAGVYYNDYEAGDVDLEIRVAPATLWFDLSPHPAGIPLAFVTATLYIWVGGPMVTHYQQYEVTLNVYDPNGGHLFEISEKDWFTHGVGFYSKEYGSRTCIGPDFKEIVRPLLSRLSEKLSESE